MDVTNFADIDCKNPHYLSVVSSKWKLCYGRATQIFKFTDAFCSSELWIMLNPESSHKIHQTWPTRKLQDDTKAIGRWNPLMRHAYPSRCFLWEPLCSLCLHLGWCPCSHSSTKQPCWVEGWQISPTKSP